MKLRNSFLVILCLILTPLITLDAFVAIGPHFGYSGMSDDRNTDMHGYVGGVTILGECGYREFFSSLEFQGTWNAGHYINSACESSSIVEYMVDWKVGRWFRLDLPCAWFKPYLGFGYDYFKDIQNPNTTHLNYTYTKLFVPIGFDIWWRKSSCCFGFQFEWRQDVNATLKLLGEDFSCSNQYGYRIQFPVVWDANLYCWDFTVSLIPFFDWNRFGSTSDDSDPMPIVFDSLRRWYTGLKILVGYQF